MLHDEDGGIGFVPGMIPTEALVKPGAFQSNLDDEGVLAT